MSALGRKLRAVVVCGAIGVATTAVGGAAATAQPAHVVAAIGAQVADGYGLHVNSANRLDDRLLEVNVSTAALAQPTSLRILLPNGYDQNPGRHYPVLYLLHGGQGDFRNWTDWGQARETTAGHDVIVVMPDGGRGGWYTNWDNFGAGGPPQWETYHIDQLVPWVDANFRTIASRQGRAIAGLSMGGFGAMSYAGRHPGLFTSVSAFSGAVDIDHWEVRALIAASPVVDGAVPGSIYGVPPFDSPRRFENNPWHIAEQYRGMHVALYTGNGQPGPLDGPPGAPWDEFLETHQEEVVHASNVALHQRLDSLGIAHTFNDYGNGQHTAGYWIRDLQWELPAIMGALADAG